MNYKYLLQIDEVNGEDYYFLYGMARKLEDIQNCFTPRLYTNMYSVANMANWMFELNFNNSKTN